MRFVCVFCGSRDGARPVYVRAARELGSELVKGGYGLVFGGGSTGLMGALADQVLEEGGQAIGVIPEIFDGRDFVHDGLHSLHVVEDMHRRKAMMYERASAFIALPGGVGTFEELLEALTWRQLGLHAKPCAVLNTHGYYDALLGQLRQAVDEGFLETALVRQLIVEAEPRTLVKRMGSEG